MKDLAIRAVTKSFGDLHVLEGVDLKIPAGSFTAILGSSGSGKTTLLRIIAGFEHLDHGEVALGDDIVDNGRAIFVPSEHRHIGYVPQEGALFPHLSVGRNVAFGLHRSPDRRQRVLELLEMVGLAGLHRRYPHQLSGGQQQRVALARALATEPEIVLLDEPFSSLDASLRASVRNEVHDVLRQAGTTTILVTHDQDEALSMADHVAVLRHGVIAQLDTPSGIYGRPLDPALARFLGESNVLRAPVGAAATDAGSDLAADTPFGSLPVEGWPTAAPAGAPGTQLLSHVMIRPEQLLIGEAESAPVTGMVESYQYFGHDAVVRVRPEAVPGNGTELPELVVRVTGGTPLRAGTRVGLRVQGAVVAWPIDGADHHHDPGDIDQHKHKLHQHEQDAGRERWEHRGREHPRGRGRRRGGRGPLEQ